MLEPIIVVRKRALDDLHSMLQQGQVPAQEELEAMFTLLGHPLSCKVSYIYAKGVVLSAIEAMAQRLYDPVIRQRPFKDYACVGSTEKVSVELLDMIRHPAEIIKLLVDKHGLEASARAILDGSSELALELADAGRCRAQVVTLRTLKQKLGKCWP